MTINIHFHEHNSNNVFYSLLNKLQMTVEQAVQELQQQSAKLDKINTEVVAVKQALADAIAAGLTIPQSLVDAINRVGAKIQAVDDLNEDAVV
jgi:hypothetical protein